jgi:hopene-associated glycosyltransferase HpnB
MMLAALSFLALAAWIALAATHFQFLKSPPRLAHPPAPAEWPSVAAVIPARNEEATISEALGGHFACDYPGPFAVVLVDDHSTDETAARARAAALAAPNRRFDLLGAPPLDAGWTGKLSAVNAGLDRLRAVAPDCRYVLLADADIVFAPETLRRLVALAESEGLALVSLMARLDSRGLWGGLLIPAFVYFFQTLYPFRDVRDPDKRTAAAAGGCLLVRRDALDRIGGVASIRARLIDDVALAAAVKASGGAIFLGAAEDEVVSRRDNRSLSSIWRMVSRSAFAQLDHSWTLLALTVVGMMALYVVPPAVALSVPLHGDRLAATVAAAAWGLMALTYLPTARLYRAAPWKTFLLPLAAFFYTLMTLSAALDHARGRGGLWKGRVYPA